MGRTLLSRHDSPLGQWTRALYFPDGALAPHVEMLWYVSGRTAFVRDRRLPNGRTHVLFNLGDDQFLFPRDAAEAPQRFATSWISGQQERFIDTGASGATTLVGAQLHAHGAYALFGIDQHELADRVIGLDAVCGDAIGALRQQLLEAATPEKCFALLERWLLRCLARGRIVHPAIRAAARQLAQAPESLRIAALSRELGLSREHLIRRFRREIGLTPKAYANIHRFERALRLGLARAAGWGEIAQCCGYFDQAHLIRDFRRYAGRAPARLLDARMPDETSIVLE